MTAVMSTFEQISYVLFISGLCLAGMFIVFCYQHVKKHEKKIKKDKKQKSNYVCKLFNDIYRKYAHNSTYYED
jgi:hypothetical protein